jgi:hypothetical protein
MRPLSSLCIVRCIPQFGQVRRASLEAAPGFFGGRGMVTQGARDLRLNRWLRREVGRRCHRSRTEDSEKLGTQVQHRSTKNDSVDPSVQYPEKLTLPPSSPIVRDAYPSTSRDNAGDCRKIVQATESSGLVRLLINRHLRTDC